MFIILGPNSMCGEDGFLYNLNNSYSVKALSSDAIIYKIDKERFSRRMNPYKKQFARLFQKRYDTIRSKTDKLKENHQFRKSIAGPKLYDEDKKTKENYQIFK